MINFYADWCRFSNMLAPIWDEAADKAREKFPEPGRVVFAKVDCDKESKKFREIKAQCGNSRISLSLRFFVAQKF